MNADGLFDAIEDYVSRAITPLVARLMEAERRLAAIPAGEKGEPGERGPSGKDAEVDYDRIGNVIAVAVQKEVGKLPVPRDGADGRDGTPGRDGLPGLKGDPGKDAQVDMVAIKSLIDAQMTTIRATMDGIKAQLEAMIVTSIASIPAGKDGPIGPEGPRGPRGEAGQSGMMGERGEAGPMGPTGPAGPQGMMGERGEAGPMGPTGPAGPQGMMGERGLDGRDGISIKGDPGEPGPRGENGRDGISPEHVSLHFDKEAGTLTLRMNDIKTAEAMGIPGNFGIHQKGRTYREGAIVTYGGSAFIAERETSAPIGGDPPSPDWRLLVQRGRDAR